MPQPAFDWSDPLNLRHQLTEEELLIQKTAHQYAQGEADASRSIYISRRTL